MKPKNFLTLTLLTLALTAQACQSPTQPVPTEAPSLTSEPPTETQTEPAATLTETPTEEPTPALPVVANPVIFDFSFFTSRRGWAVTQDGNTLLVTGDGGATWLNATPAALAGASDLFFQPFYLNETTAWFTPAEYGATSAMLYHTEDAGVSWTTTPVPFDNARYFFLNLTSGFALVDLGAAAGSHYVALYQTSDGGANWTEVFTHEPGASKSLPESGSKSGIAFLDVNQGWIGGAIPMEDYFYLYTTTDSGFTWAQETDITLPGAYAGNFLEVWQPFFRSNTVAYLPVRALTADGDTLLLVYRSADGGQSWTFQNAIPDGRVVDFTTVDQGWAGGGTSLLTTTDGGVTWTPSGMTGIPAGDGILNLDFVDDQNGWVLTTPDESTWTPLRLFRTTDGGASWTQLLP